MHLCFRDGESWRVIPISDALSIDLQPDGTLVVGPRARALATFVSFSDHGPPAAALVTAPHARVTVNGFRPLGVSVLTDRDEIRLGSTRVLFSAYSPAREEPFPSDARETRCARCKVRLQPGDTAARCPVCGAWHHQGPLAGDDGERRCLSYDPQCGIGRHDWKKALWTPEEEEKESDDAAG